MQIALIAAAFAVIAVLPWLATLRTQPRWVLLLGIVGIACWISLFPGWMRPVDSMSGSCRSVLSPKHPSGDLDCGPLRAEAAYNPSVPVFFGGSLALPTAGLTSLALSLRGSRAREVVDGRDSG